MQIYERTRRESIPIKRIAALLRGNAAVLSLSQIYSLQSQQVTELGGSYDNRRSRVVLQIVGNKAGIWLGKRNLVKYAIITVWESFGCFCTYFIKTFIANAFDYPRHLFVVKFTSVMDGV